MQQKNRLSLWLAYVPFGLSFGLMLFSGADILEHAFLFLLLGFFAAFATLARRNRASGLAFFESWALTILCGALSELHHYYVPVRDCSSYGWFADALGALLGVILYFMLFRRFKKRRIFSR